MNKGGRDTGKKQSLNKINNSSSARKSKRPSAVGTPGISSSAVGTPEVSASVIGNPRVVSFSTLSPGTTLISTSTFSSNNYSSEDYLNLVSKNAADNNQKIHRYTTIGNLPTTDKSGLSSIKFSVEKNYTTDSAGSRSQESASEELSYNKKMELLEQSFYKKLVDFDAAMQAQFKNQLTEFTTSYQEYFDESKRDVESKFAAWDIRVNESLENFKTETAAVKNSVLGAIAIFAALFTFVSLNVNIFTKSSTMENAWLMFIMWMALVGFIYVFFINLNSSVKEQSIENNMPVIVIGVVIFASMVFLGNVSERSKNDNNAACIQLESNKMQCELKK